jgi:peptide/nickel transport system substrate-binding protein
MAVAHGQPFVIAKAMLWKLAVSGDNSLRPPQTAAADVPQRRQADIGLAGRCARRVQQMGTLSRRKFVGAGLATVGLATLSASQAGAERGAGPAGAVEALHQAAAQNIVIGIGVDPISLDPRQTAVTEATSLTHAVNEELLFRDDAGTTIPYLAKSWEYPSPTTLVLHLQPGLTFANGEPCDAAAVKYTIESVIDPANAWVAAEKRGWFEAVDHIVATDAATVTITLKQQNHAVFSYLTLLGIVPPKAAQAAGGSYGNAPSGTGPYALANYTPGDHLELTARPGYWGGAPKNQKVTVRFIQEDATRLASLQAGEVHVISNVSPDALASIKSNGQLEVLSVPSVRTVFIAFMTDRAPFNNLQLRQAISYAVDRGSIVKDLLGGNGEVAQSIYAPGVGYFAPQTPYAFDPEKAKALIKQSGFDTSQTLKFAYPTGRTVNDKAVGEAVGGMIQAVGLNVQLDAPEWGTFLDNYQKKRIYDFVIASMSPDNLDPDYALSPWFRSDTSFIKYSNPTVDDLLKKGASATDSTQEAQIYQQLQKMLWEDLPYAPLYVVPQLWAKSKKLTGFSLRRDSIFVFKDAVLA